jgi:transcription elongation factor GreA-like protein
MKASILITGSISGNFILSDKIWQCGAKINNLSFGQILIQFESVKEAKMALKLAYKELKNESLVFLNQYSWTLSYDNSKAVIRKGF